MNKIPYALTLPKNDNELKDYIYKLYGVKVPDVAVCEGHKSPFDFISDLFFQRENKILGIGSRGSSKTFLVGLLTSLNSNFKPGLESAIIGGTKDQANKCYLYFKDFIKVYKDFGRIKEKNILMSQSTFEPMYIKRLKKELKSNVYMLVSTLSGCNSSHPNILCLDEIKSIGQSIYEESLNTYMDGNGYNRQMILTSSRDSSSKGTGLEQSILDAIENNPNNPFNFKLYMWCVWEASERCKSESCNECKEIQKGNYADGSPRTFYSVCKGKMKRSNGFKKRENVIDDFMTMAPDTWDIQQECKGRDVEGKVYYWFNIKDCVEEFEIPEDFEDIKFYESIDWGGNDPSVCTFWMCKNNMFFCYDEIYLRQIPNSDFVELIKYKRKEWGTFKNNKLFVEGTFCDPSGTQGVNEFAKAGVDVKKAKNSIDDGISIINSLGCQHRIIIHPRCSNTISEFNGYYYRKGGFRGQDHAMDTLRYLFLEINPIMYDDTNNNAPDKNVDKNIILQNELSYNKLWNIDSDYNYNYMFDGSFNFNQSKW